jgi:FAD/FMN-containing dehydrogenase
MNQPKRLARWRNVLLAVILALTLYVTARKVDELSADPVGEKECAPLSPATAGDPTKSNVVEVKVSPVLPWAQKGGTLNDASCLNQTAVYGVVQVKTEDDIGNALQYARENKLRVALSAVRHSMGGHAFAPNALVLDMLKFNRMSLDETNRVLTVQSGATWHDIQNFLHPKYAVKAMQSTDIFSVGGSIAVNAHGMDHQAGSVGRTIRSMRVMLADGTIQRVSRTARPELFQLVIGGYGLFGVILDAEIEVTPNVVYTTGRRLIDYKEFPALFANELSKDKTLGLFYGHLSTDPRSLLQEMILYTYHEANAPDAQLQPLGEVSSIKLRRLVFNASKLGSLPMWFKWFAEKNIEPHLEACTVTRNQAMKDGEACLVSRNDPMHDSVPYLRNNLKNETDILQEYFIPRDQFIVWVDEARRIMQTNETNLLNASVRVIQPEENFLNYAPREMFAIVLYINQHTTDADNARMQKLTRELIDLTLKAKGTFFLPYQLYYTPQQLQQTYPQIKTFFAAKQTYDPNGLFTNTFYERYGNSVR